MSPIKKDKEETPNLSLSKPRNTNPYAVENLRS